METKGLTCPVFHIEQFLQVRPPCCGPLFCHFNGKALTRYQFSALLSKVLKCLGLEAKHYKAHSFRIGAATSAAIAGQKMAAIQAAGRWKSSAYESYIRV